MASINFFFRRTQMAGKPCIYLEENSDEELVCKKDFSANISCETGEGVRCLYYSNNAEAQRDLPAGRRADDAKRDFLKP